MSFNPFEPIPGLSRPAFDWLQTALPAEPPALTAAAAAAALPTNLSLSKLGLDASALNETLQPKVHSALADLVSPGYSNSLLNLSPISEALKTIELSSCKVETALPKAIGVNSPAMEAALTASAMSRPFSWLDEPNKPPVSPMLSGLIGSAFISVDPLGLRSSAHVAASLVGPSIRSQSLVAALTRPSELLAPLVASVPEALRVPEVIEASRLTALTDNLLPRTAATLSTGLLRFEQDLKCVGDNYTAFLRSVPACEIDPTLFAIPSRSYFQSGDLFLEIPQLPRLKKPLQRARELTRSELGNYAESRLGPFLDKVNPKWRKMWEGAHVAATSNNPDKLRHAMISLRELFTQVIHSLAPDADVRSWTTNSHHFHRGRPTREARLLYICSPVSDGALSGFVVPDIRSVIALADVFQQGTHGVDVEMSSLQLRLVFRRLEGALCNLIDIRTASE